jgi:hypothetical protein
MVSYEDFLVQKQIVAAPQGIGVSTSALHPRLFDWQAAITSWALRRGRSALIEDCGLGKTFQQLEWSRQIHLRHGYDILILAPLAVAEQTKAEGEKFDIPVNLCRDGSQVQPGINITNYELLHRFDTRRFAAVVLDESSILKSHTGQTRNQIIDLFAHTEYRLACTATPAPNDHMELGNHAEFLGVMPYRNMLATFFVHDGGDTSKWRLKGHAADAFWRWVSSWAMMIGKPSDIGFSDDGFTLPPIHRHQITVESDAQEDEYLFSVEARGMLERNAARKDSLTHRVAACAATVNATREPFLVWCDRNPESEALAAAIPGAVEVTGSQDNDRKAGGMLAFTEGRARVLISKPSICGFGMNWQHCANIAFVGLSDSFEQIYQAERRCWRFGQTKPVNVYVFTSEREGAVISNINRKQRDFEEMSAQMRRHMQAGMIEHMYGSPHRQSYSAKKALEVPSWLQ